MSERIYGPRGSEIKITRRESGDVLYHLFVDNLINYNFREKDLTDADLSGMNLSGCDFTDADLAGADMSNCNLTGCKFFGCNTSGTKFDGSVLQGAEGLSSISRNSRGASTFYNASWRSCDFSGVDISWVEFHKKKDAQDFFDGCRGIDSIITVFKAVTTRQFIPHWTRTSAQGY